VPTDKRWTGYVIVAAVALLFLLFAAVRYFHQPPATTEFHGRATIQTDPPGALVVLADHAQKSPAVFEDLEPRKYKLRIMSPGYEPVETTIDFGSGKATEPPTFHLVRSTGRLVIDSKPSGLPCSIQSEDGGVVRTGTAPLSLDELPTGKYSVTVTNRDWKMRDTVEVSS